MPACHLACEADRVVALRRVQLPDDVAVQGDREVAQPRAVWAVTGGVCGVVAHAGAASAYRIDCGEQPGEQIAALLFTMPCQVARPGVPPPDVDQCVVPLRAV